MENKKKTQVLRGNRWKTQGKRKFANQWKTIQNTRKTQVLKRNLWKTHGKRKCCIGIYGKHKRHWFCAGTYGKHIENTCFAWKHIENARTTQVLRGNL